MRKALFYSFFGIIAIILVGTQTAYMELSHISGYATTMIHLKAWMQQGFSTLHFSPSYTQGNVGDRFIQFYQGPIDANGNCYYTSFPPGALWLSYLWIKLVPVEMGFSLGLFNTLLFLLSLIGLSLWAFKFLEVKSNIERKWLIPSSILLIGLTPLFLFFFSNYYFIENIAFTLSIWASYFLWNMQQETELNSYNTFLAGITILLLSLCESIGFMYATVFIYLLFNRNKEWKFWFGVILLSALVILSLYSSINGLFNFIKSSLIRIVGRNGWTGSSLAENGATIWNGSLFRSALHILQSEASPYLFLSFCAIFLLFIAKRRNEEIASSKGILFSILPIIGHIILFANANLQHHQLIIKTLIIVWPILLIGFSSKKALWSILFIGAASLSFIQLGYRFNYKQLDEERNIEQLATEIKSLPKTTTIEVECSSIQIEQLPVLIYFSERNISCFKNQKGKFAKPEMKILKVDSFWHATEQHY
jgi:hypothetical protein